MGAITGDAIAGFFEGSIAEWLRRRGIEEARTELGSALVKMSGRDAPRNPRIGD